MPAARRYPGLDRLRHTLLVGLLAGCLIGVAGPVLGQEEELQEQLDRAEAELALEVANGEVELSSEITAERLVVEDDREETVRRRPRPRRRSSGSDARWAIGSTIKIDRDEVVSDAVAILGGLKVEGEVQSSAVAIGGPAKIDGLVWGDVVSVGGGVELGARAEVRGNVTSVGGRIEREDGSVVLGEISEVAFGPVFELDDDPWELFGGGGQPFWRSSWIDWLWALFRSFMLAMMASLILLVLPEPVDRVLGAAAREPWKAGLVGVALELFFFPILLMICLLLTVSIIGIPLLLFVPFAVLLFFAAALFGYTAVAVGLGRFVRRRFGLGLRNTFLMLLIGIFLIQSASLLAEFFDALRIPFPILLMFILFGFTAKYIAWTIGLGAVIVSRFGSTASRRA